jgi:RNA polymerase sigma-70 factor (ECF subfamily)
LEVGVTDAGTGHAAGSLAEMLDERQHLLEVATWMFGSAGLADRIVEETYRRWYALSDDELAGIAVPRAWLTKVAEGICLELLAFGAGVLPQVTATTAARTSHPATTGHGEPAAASAAPAAARSSVEHPRLHNGAAREMVDRHDRVARRFAAACRTADTAALAAVLAADAVVVSDGGGKLRAAVRPVHGADEVAGFVAALLSGQPGTALTAELVNGRTGLVLRQAGQAVAVVSLSVAEAAVTAVWIVLNPDKLESWKR